MFGNRNSRITLVFTVICLALTVNAASAKYTVIVKSGDWIKYDITISAAGENMTGSMKLTIQSVQEYFITGTYEISVQGFSVTLPENFTLDISTGGGDLGGFIIPANLTSGDWIPGEGLMVDVLTDWRGRKAIASNTSAPLFGFEGQVYWDQATGVLLEISGAFGGTDYKIAAAESSLWSSGLLGLDLTWWILIIIAIIVVVALVALLMRRRRRATSVPTWAPPTEAPPPPPPPP